MFSLSKVAGSFVGCLKSFVGKNQSSKANKSVSLAREALFPQLCGGKVRTKKGMSLEANRRRFLSYYDKPIKEWSQTTLKASLAYCKFIASSDDVTEGQKMVIRTFFDRLVQEGEGKFNAKLSVGKDLPLQRVLSPKLDELLKKEEANPSLAFDKNHRFQVAMAKGTLAASMGVGVQRTAGGLNGACLIKDFEGNILGVFKPNKVLSATDLTELMKLQFAQASHLSPVDQQNLLGEKKAQTYNEVAGYLVSEKLGFNLAPQCQMTEIAGAEGVFIDFLGGYQELDEVISDVEERFTEKKLTQKELTMLQIHSVFRFLITDLDAKSDSCFVKMDPSTGAILDVKAIDAGNGFVHERVGKYGLQGNCGAYGKLAWSSDLWTAETVEFVRNMKREDLYAAIQHIQGSLPDYFTDEMSYNLLENFYLLKNGVGLREIATPSELARIKTNQDYRDFSDSSDLEKTILIDEDQEVRLDLGVFYLSDEEDEMDVDDYSDDDEMQLDDSDDFVIV